MFGTLIRNTAIVTSVVVFLFAIIEYLYSKISERTRTVISFWTEQIVEMVQKMYPDAATKKKVAVDFLVNKFHISEDVASVWVEAVLLQLELQYGYEDWKAMAPAATVEPTETKEGDPTLFPS